MGSWLGAMAHIPGFDFMRANMSSDGVDVERCVVLVLLLEEDVVLDLLERPLPIERVLGHNDGALVANVAALIVKVAVGACLRVVPLHKGLLGAERAREHLLRPGFEGDEALPDAVQEELVDGPYRDDGLLPLRDPPAKVVSVGLGVVQKDLGLDPVHSACHLEVEHVAPADVLGHLPPVCALAVKLHLRGAQARAVELAVDLGEAVLGRVVGVHVVPQVGTQGANAQELERGDGGELQVGVHHDVVHRGVGVVDADILRLEVVEVDAGKCQRLLDVNIEPEAECDDRSRAAHSPRDRFAREHLQPLLVDGLRVGDGQQAHDLLQIGRV
eukprot:scaffold37249_cov236-Isochrysis_galbana.AAC.2